MNMPNPFEIDSEIALLEASVNDERLYKAQLSRIASLPEMVEDTRPAIEETLSADRDFEEIRQGLVLKNAARQQFFKGDMIRKFPLEQRSHLLMTLKDRLAEKLINYKRPKGINFLEVKSALEADLALMYTLSRSEKFGGAPDIIYAAPDGFLFADCFVKPPSARRNLIYDHAYAMAESFGASHTNEAEYRFFQKAGKFDINKFWVWIMTPDPVREDGHALHGNRDGSVVSVGRRAAMHHDKEGGWRCMLWVPKA